MIPFIDMEYTPEEEEAWNLFLRKFENIEIQPMHKTIEIDKEEEIYKKCLTHKQ